MIRGLQPYGWTGQPDTCRWCGRPLTGWRLRALVNYPGLFDNRTCAEQFGVALASQGVQLEHATRRQAVRRLERLERQVQQRNEAQRQLRAVKAAELANQQALNQVRVMKSALRKSGFDLHE